MATPLSADKLLVALRSEGCLVVEHKDWRNHNRNHKGAWGPVNGVMIHHTVTSGTDSSVALCYNGHSTLPGPLCHTVGAKDGRLFMVGHGRANHAGKGDPDVLRAVINETGLPRDNEATVDGNARFYGLEMVNLGNGKDPWPDVQVEAAVRWAAAICRAHGWSAASVIGHKEWQPGKIDPLFDMDDFRRRVGDRLARTAGMTPARPQEDDMALTDEDVKKVAAAVWAHMADNVLGDDPAKLPMERRSWGNTARLARVEKALKAQATTIDKLVDAVSAGTGTDVEALKAEIREAIESVTVRLEVDDS